MDYVGVRVVEQIVQAIEQIGGFALEVIVVWVAVMLLISFIDRHPSRRDSARKPTQTSQSLRTNGKRKYSQPDRE